MLPTWLHGAIDYALAVLLLFSPWLFAYDDQGAATWSAVFIAVAVIAYSLCTDYECSLFRYIPMRLHLVLDGIVGIGLILSPFLFRFAEDSWLFHLAFGAAWLIGPLISQTVPLPHRRRLFP